MYFVDAPNARKTSAPEIVSPYIPYRGLTEMLESRRIWRAVCAYIYGKRRKSDTQEHDAYSRRPLHTR